MVRLEKGDRNYYFLTVQNLDTLTGYYWMASCIFNRNGLQPIYRIYTLKKALAKT